MQCELCRNEPQKEDSHIVPAFVFRWLKVSSPTGFLRRTGEVNKRINDGDKSKLLGPACEDLFSGWEKQFAEKIFHPIHKLGQSNLAFDYDQWLPKFCVSLSWRVLTHLTRDGADYLPHSHSSLVQPTLEVWRDYLCGRREDVAGYRQHLLILDKPTSVPEGMNLDDLSIYISRGVDCDTIHAIDECYVMSKICNVLIVGSILEKPSNWEGTDVSIPGGRYESRDFYVSPCVVTLFETALCKLRQGRGSISTKQSNKILETFEKKHGLRKRK